MIAVVGLWHLGSVTAACLAAAGHQVVGLDDDPQVVADLSQGRPPVFEPGLAELVQEQVASGRLRFASQPEAMAGADVVWVAYDTPIDAADRADVGWVTARVAALFPHLAPRALVLLSSQLPVGTTRELEAMYRRLHPTGTASFAYSPENLRLGKALDAFRRAERIVVGLRAPADRERLERLLQPFTARIEWMSVESAEMTKHALNAFLATSVAFTNEIATLCERVGADAREVERGLRSDSRVGPRAYVRPGDAFGGGTLARDLEYLGSIGRRSGTPPPLLASVQPSNEAHKTWIRRRLQDELGALTAKTIAVFGLTYTTGTDTLRRSNAVELCGWLGTQGASVRAYDAAIEAVPAELAGFTTLCRTPDDALRDAHALVIGVESPDAARLTADELVRLMGKPLVVDPGRVLESRLGADDRIRYVAVGRPA